MTSYIYSITNKLTDMAYIGKTNNLKERFYTHCSCKTSYIGHALKKYGKENFLFNVIHECLTEIDAYKLEHFYIEYLKTQAPNGYNLALGGEGGRTGVKHSDKTKKKISETEKGKIVSEETRKKMSEAHKGIKPIIIDALNIHQKGENHPMYGKHHTEETKEKLRQANVGKKFTEETRKKMSMAKKGIPPKSLAQLILNNKENPYRAKTCMCIETGEIFKSYKEASIAKNISHSNICEVINGKRKTAGGYHWKLIGE